MKDYRDDRFCGGLGAVHLEVGAGAAQACVGSLVPRPGALFAMPVGPRVGACGLRPARAYILALALSWESGRSWLILPRESYGSPWVWGSPSS